MADGRDKNFLFHCLLHISAFYRSQVAVVFSSFFQHFAFYSSVYEPNVKFMLTRQNYLILELFYSHSPLSLAFHHRAENNFRQFASATRTCCTFLRGPLCNAICLSILIHSLQVPFVNFRVTLFAYKWQSLHASMFRLYFDTYPALSVHHFTSNVTISFCSLFLLIRGMLQKQFLSTRLRDTIFNKIENNIISLIRATY